MESPLRTIISNLIADGRFREDPYYRIIEITVDFPAAADMGLDHKTSAPSAGSSAGVVGNKDTELPWSPERHIGPRQ